MRPPACKYKVTFGKSPLWGMSFAFYKTNPSNLLKRTWKRGIWDQCMKTRFRKPDLIKELDADSLLLDWWPFEAQPGIDQYTYDTFPIRYHETEREAWDNLKYREPVYEHIPVVSPIQLQSQWAVRYDAGRGFVSSSINQGGTFSFDGTQIPLWLIKSWDTIARVEVRWEPPPNCPAEVMLFIDKYSWPLKNGIASYPVDKWTCRRGLPDITISTGPRWYDYDDFYQHSRYIPPPSSLRYFNPIITLWVSIAMYFKFGDFYLCLSEYDFKEFEYFALFDRVTNKVVGPLIYMREIAFPPEPPP